MKQGLVWIVLAGVVLLGYPAGYAGLRLTRVMVHEAYFVGATIDPPHTIHAMDGDMRVRALYQPLIELELSLHLVHSP